MSEDSANAGRAPEQVATVVAAIETQLATLDDLAQAPLTDHADAYQSVHVALQSALAEIDSA